MNLPSQNLMTRYADALLPVFGQPQLVLARGEGAYVWDVDDNRYLDLLGGIAVNALGHNHPALSEALAQQAATAVHISNFFTSPAQIAAAEAIVERASAPVGSRVFFSNSGTEAIEAAIKLARRTGRTEIVAFEGAFHGRSTGALALTHKAAYREPFEPLLPGVRHVPYNDVAALRAAVTEDTAAVIVEPIQGEAGVVVPTRGFLAAIREITVAAGALMIVDEIQTGVGRTGDWFAYQSDGVVPDAITLAKGLGGGVPIGALVTFGHEVSGLLSAGQHGSTFGGNPLAATAALTVLETISARDLVPAATALGQHFAAAVATLDHPAVVGTRGRGLLQAIELGRPVAAHAVAEARRRGFIINAVTPTALRIAPPLIITTPQLDSFVAALPDILDAAQTTSEAAT